MDTNRKVVVHSPVAPADFTYLGPGERFPWRLCGVLWAGVLVSCVVVVRMGFIMPVGDRPEQSWAQTRVVARIQVGEPDWTSITEARGQLERLGQAGVGAVSLGGLPDVTMETNLQTSLEEFSEFTRTANGHGLKVVVELRTLTEASQAAMDTWASRGAEGFHIYTNIVTIETHDKISELRDHLKAKYPDTVLFVTANTTMESSPQLPSVTMVADLTRHLSTDCGTTPQCFQRSLESHLASLPKGSWPLWQVTKMLSTAGCLPSLHLTASLLLPGATMLHPSHLLPRLPGSSPPPPSTPAAIPDLQTLLALRARPSFKWGDTRVLEAGGGGGSVLSFSRSAMGRGFARYLVILNYGTEPSTHDLMEEAARLKGMGTGRVVLVFGEGGGGLQGGEGCGQVEGGCSALLHQTVNLSRIQVPSCTGLVIETWSKSW